LVGATNLLGKGSPKNSMETQYTRHASKAWTRCRSEDIL